MSRVLRPSDAKLILGFILGLFAGVTLTLFAFSPSQAAPGAPGAALVATAQPEPKGAPVAASTGSRAGVLVLGMHRSGTSLLTGLLGRSGFWTADSPGELLGSGGDHLDNKKGFYERMDLLHQDDFFLKHQHADWSRFVWRYDPKVTLRALEDPGSTLVDWSGNRRVLWDEGRGLMRKLQTPRDAPFVLKDPRLCLTAPVWFELLTKELEPAVVLAKRSPLEVARSLNKRQDFGVRRGLLLWIQYNRLAIEASYNRCTVLVDNREVLSDTVGQLRRVLGELRACGVDIHPDQVVPEEVHEWVDPNLQHDQQGDGCTLRRSWTDVRDPQNPAEPPDIGDVYNLAMKVYCDMGSGEAFKFDYDWTALLAQVPYINEVT